MPTKNQRRVETLERMVKDAGMLDAKVDVTRYFKIIQEVYGMPGEVEPVYRRAGEWQRFTDTVLQVYG